MLECVINVSEGRDRTVVARLAAAGAPCVLDVHSDPDHHRSVLTLGDPDASALEASVRAVAVATVEQVDIGSHTGAHPRLGALDVVPFVALDRVGARLADGPLGAALSARDRFASWAGSQLHLPCFLYGPERSLPDVRRGAWSTLQPDHGPDLPHPSAGAAAVGARPALVAYNLWLEPGAPLDLARRLAASVRAPAVRTLGLALGERVQVSCNLVDPWQVGPGQVYDRVAALLPGPPGAPGAGIERAELVGLIPAGVLAAEPAQRWAELGLDPAQTIEARLEEAGLDGGSFGRSG